MHKNTKYACIINKYACIFNKYAQNFTKYAQNGAFTNGTPYLMLRDSRIAALGCLSNIVQTFDFFPKNSFRTLLAILQ